MVQIMTTSNAHPSLDRRLSSSVQHHLTSSHSSISRGPIELPRPVEPRATHHFQTPQADFSSSVHSPDAGLGHTRVNSDLRPNGQSLPGVRDILSPPIHSPPYQWPVSNSDRPNGPHHDHQGWHRPLAFQPPPEPSQSHSVPFERRSEYPMPMPGRRNTGQSIPESPIVLDQHRGRLSQASNSSYQTSVGAPSPYLSSSAEDSAYASPPNGTRLHLTTNPQTGTLSDRPPKLMGRVEVPGEGAYFVYEDGTRLPTSVDNEPVNPEWGLTKANKPRKRLASACLDCREKKIKCDYAVNGCGNCVKAKRPCRKAPNQQQARSDASSSSWAQSPSGQDASFPLSRDNVSRGSDILSKRRMHDNSSPSSKAIKKHRSTSPHEAPREHLSFGSVSSNGYVIPPPFADPGQRTFSFADDPMLIDPGTTLHIIDLYFTHLNNAIWFLFPQKAFVHWLRTSKTKTHNEKLVLYAMLAVGTIFADERVGQLGHQFSQIASLAMMQDPSSMSLASSQAWLMLSMYHASKGEDDIAWDYIGTAIRICTNPKHGFNTEGGCADIPEGHDVNAIDFYMNRDQLAECKRRTFWACFVMDRSMEGTQYAINSKDVFVRLPCSDSMYERGQRSDAPFFNNNIVDSVSSILTPASSVSPMAWMIQLTNIYGDVMNFIKRAARRPESTYRERYEAFYKETHDALQCWSSLLPDHLTYGTANMNRSLREGYAKIFITMHSLYHFTLMRLNRCVRHRLMLDNVGRNIRCAHYHANAMLGIAKTLRSASGDLGMGPIGHPNDLGCSSPSIAPVITYAVDILSAGGFDSNIASMLESINSGIYILDQLARCWHSAHVQSRDCHRRYLQIQNILTRPYKAKSGCWLGREWGVEMPLDRTLRPEHDCIYGITETEGLPNAVYFDALKDAAAPARIRADSRQAI
ncbi:Hypothetical protein R9X50_00675700 [Acrodontium crateriforme]|uniref:Zn(2)-C6 fungal-type domain-containing protein n=1 Tax=Acrodontium crateriforme TaxID=150365 RepID=A0AAQ3M8Z7_9PEZI|nr:Hypothetical protein R9X50_00675700 [Acrodontium crateriforme]